MKLKSISLFAITFFLANILNGQEIFETSNIIGDYPNFGLTYSNSRVFCASMTYDVSIINVEDHFNPYQSGFLDLAVDFPYSIKTADNYAYIGGGYIGYLIIADISDPDNPVQTSILTDIYGTCHELHVQGNYVFILTNSDTLYSIDVSDKNLPVIADKLPLGYYCHGFAICGNYGYVGKESEVHIINISNPNSLFVESTFSGNYFSFSADNENNRLICSVNQTNGGFDVFDILNPLSPEFLYNGNDYIDAGKVFYSNNHVLFFGLHHESLFCLGVDSATLLGSYNFSVMTDINDAILVDTMIYNSTSKGFTSTAYGTPSASSLKEISNENTFDIFPNPVDETLSIKLFSGLLKTEIFVYNFSGILVKKVVSVSDVFSLDVTDLKSGFYIISIKNDVLSEQKIFIKN